MHPFELLRPATVEAALAGDGEYLAGGTTLVDLMKLNVMTPHQVLDIGDLPLRGISADGGLSIGALELMSDLADHPAVYPMISQALRASASQQLRNMATIGGNLLQRTRCAYFRDTSSACNKRRPGSGCSAFAGHNRMHSILGGSRDCVATHASDVAVALVALDAELRLVSRDGPRSMMLADFFLLPGETPHVENRLLRGELITEIHVPELSWATNSVYVKVRDRQSYEFALSSAAVAAKINGSRIEDVRLAVGGVATVPWRLTRVEAALRGSAISESAFNHAARLAVDEASPLPYNKYKVPLLQRTIVRALLDVTREHSS